VPSGTAPSHHAPLADSAWPLTLAASALAAELDAAGVDAAFAQSTRGDLRPAAGDDPDVVLIWRRGRGWESRLPAGDPRADVLDLYLPLCSATAARPITVGHLGQSVDGFIATHSGDSQFVTGRENIVHLHALRALCDAVVVGAGTVAADDPQLTTRHVTGPDPLRVVFDPTRRLSAGYRVFSDAASPTLYVCEAARLQPDETHVGEAVVAGIELDGDGGAVGALLRLLRGRGCARVFVEGGGVTVSAFLETNLLDRLHLAIAPVLIGEGRPAIRLTARERLRDCARPRYRVFRMGGDVLFDYELGASAPPETGEPAAAPRVSRII
jgi:diaminohydroxyphosphoribosylaminopyrimidine deaminase / 5-amino-6-(5-phosphoribosylamino)uracil reductase